MYTATSFLKHTHRVFTRNIASLLYGILAGIAQVFNILDEDYRLALKAAAIFSAEGNMLDFWGWIFNISRFPGESDSLYRENIRIFAIFGKVTSTALVEAISPYSTITPSVEELIAPILINSDYSDFSYETHDKGKFMVRITYRPAGSVSSYFVIGKAYVGVSTYAYSITKIRFTKEKVRIKAENAKMAGIKLLYKIG